MDKDIELLLDAEAIQLKKLQEIVKKTIAEESLIINNLLNQPQEILTRGQSISDKVASFGGSWKFIITFGFILLIWIIYNSVTIINQRFDPYPFILLNLILIAAWNVLMKLLTLYVSKVIAVFFNGLVLILIFFFQCQGVFLIVWLDYQIIS